MAEQKADRGISQIEKEMRKLAHLMGEKAGIGTQRRQRGGWR
jgi:hypothetical protein